jgi:hypothetical protein
VAWPRRSRLVRRLIRWPVSRLVRRLIRWPGRGPSRAWHWAPRPAARRGASPAPNCSFTNPRGSKQETCRDSVESGPSHGRFVHDPGGERPGGGRIRVDSLSTTTGAGKREESAGADVRTRRERPDEARTSGRGANVRTRRERPDEARTPGRGTNTGTRHEHRDEARTPGRGTNTGTRHEHRDEARTPGRGTNTGTRHEHRDEARTPGRGTNTGTRRERRDEARPAPEPYDLDHVWERILGLRGQSRAAGLATCPGHRQTAPVTGKLPRPPANCTTWLQCSSQSPSRAGCSSRSPTS